MLKGTWGIEIEVGVASDFKLLPCWQVTTDGSIHTKKYNVRAVELVSHVFRTHKDLITSLLQYEGKFLDANISMGVHIHFKPGDLNYGIFCNKEFIEFFLTRLEKRWSNLYKMRQNNGYCKIFNDTI